MKYKDNLALRSARPSLWAVSPLICSIVIGFIVLNAGFALSLLWGPSRVHYIVETGFFNNNFWAGAFGLLSLGMLAGIILNDWILIRWSLIAGLTVKFIWWFAFIALALQIGFRSTIASLAFWFFVTAVQGAAVVFFVPAHGAHDEPWR